MPAALSALRYFLEELPEQPVVGAGSLLEFALGDRHFSMPAGRVEYLHMGPMTFSEFLLALEENKLHQLIATWQPGQPIHEVVHDIGYWFCCDSFTSLVERRKPSSICLDGQRLVKVSVQGNYAERNVEYRLENDSTKRIFSYGSASQTNKAPHYFRVWREVAPEFRTTR